VIVTLANTPVLCRPLWFLCGSSFVKRSLVDSEILHAMKVGT